MPYGPLRRGRWLSADPLGEAGGLNLYAYCYGNPLNFYDPDGLTAAGAWDSVNRELAWWGSFVDVDFDQGTLNALKLGAMATADGFIPFSDPFQLSGGYGGCEDGIGFSKGAGAFSRDVAIMATGLPLSGSKSFIWKGSAKGTNAARLLFNRIGLGRNLPKWFPWRAIKSPVGFPPQWKNTANIAGVLGRYWPYVMGAGAGGSDVKDLNGSPKDCE